MLRAVIIDDERKSRENLQLLLESYVEGIEVVGDADGVRSGVEVIEAKQPDVVFLDIHLKSGDGFEILEQLSGGSQNVIFVTGHEEHAVKAFRSDAVDYLLKPVQIEHLQQAVERVEKRRLENGYERQLSISTSKGLIFLRTKDILYCRGDGAYTYFYLQDGQRITTSKNLKFYEEALKGQPFYRCHKSYLVNLNAIQTYVRGEGGYAVMPNGDQVLISKRKKEAFLAAMRSA